MWLGPAPNVAFNLNRWGVRDKAHPDFGSGFPTFRYFWDYGGGAMTDWGVHLIDPMHQCFDEVMPVAISAQGDKFYVDDNCETPDTMLATFKYPKFLMSYESRTCNPLPLFGLGQSAGTVIGGTEGTIFVNRSKCQLIPHEGRWADLGKRSSDGANERSPLEELDRVHQVAREAHERN